MTHSFPTRLASALGGLREGRDPARPARTHRRPELRPLGLHLFLHQDPARAPRPGAAGACAGDDDAAVPEGLFGAAGPHLPPPRRACRSEERRVGKEGVSTYRSWWAPYT